MTSADLRRTVGKERGVGGALSFRGMNLLKCSVWLSHTEKLCLNVFKMHSGEQWHQFGCFL